MKSEERNRLLKDKLNYIIDAHIDGGAEELTRVFGYERQNAVSNMCSNNSKNAVIRKVHMESIETHYQIPLSIWNHDVPFDKKLMNEMIYEYRFKLNKQEREKKEYFNYQKLLKEGLLNFSDRDTIFQKNNRLFEKLKGVWYAYLYASNPKSASETEGIWIVETTIYDDYSVVDYWENRGYLKIGKHESLIIKESYDNDDLTVIRFPNRQVPSQNFRFVIISNQNNTTNEMVNFGFYSRKKYTPQEAKRILGDKSKSQLKLDLEFNDRINIEGVVPK
ncbi:hypothetical protein MNB_SV-12-373 [hydrothermal vent metagenome]|uniref:Uncharacterized protein n=1 Tax=hydrothermal vent metagenome TaxID=652676 RepID=A0A1W1CC67_9ZZZZ